MKKTVGNVGLMIWQDAFEWSYYDQVLAGVKASSLTPNPLKGASSSGVASFQAIFCIDEREDSLRRHLEATDQNCETLGAPGFFGVEFYFQPQFGQFYEKLCPAPVTPKYLIKEFDVTEHRKHELLYTKKAHNALQGFFISLSLGVVAVGQLVLNQFRPKMSPAISDAFAHMKIGGQLAIDYKGESEKGLQLGFTVDEMALRVENLLRGVGMVKNFAPIFYVVAHGSSSANNPHHGAHDCGACSGRPGSVNARVFAYMANKPEVRAILAQNGLHIPTTTQFVGALHDTAADEIAFYDESSLSLANVMFQYIWTPLKKMGTALDFISSKATFLIFIPIYAAGLYAVYHEDMLPDPIMDFLPVVFGICGLFMILKAFVERQDAQMAWGFIILNQLFTSLSIGFNEQFEFSQIHLYLSGIAVSGLVVFLCLRRLVSSKESISLDGFQGHSYTYPALSFVFLIASLGLSGFPITPTFIGEDLILGHIHENQFVLLVLRRSV